MSKLQTDRFVMGGKPVRCPHCGGEAFDKREILLNTRGATFLKLDWLNRGATTLTCTKCGRIEWFSEPAGSGDPCSDKKRTLRPDPDAELKRRANDDTL